MGRPKKHGALEKTIPLRISRELLEQVKEASRLTGRSETDIIREAIRIGLEAWRRIGFDTAGAIVDKANADRPGKITYLPDETQSLRVAEEPLQKNCENS